MTLIFSAVYCCSFFGAVFLSAVLVEIPAAVFPSLAFLPVFLFFSLKSESLQISVIGNQQSVISKTFTVAG
jgi:hypothetical protein